MKEVVLEEWIDDKRVWWKVFWKMICMVVLNYTDDQKEATAQFFWSLKSLIPCPECASHYKAKILLFYPFFGTNKNNLQQFVSNIYNTIEAFSWREPSWNWELIRDKYLGEEIDKQTELLDLQS